MEATAPSQRRRAHRRPGDSAVIRIEMKDRMGNPRWVTADLLDITEHGFRVAVMTPLKPKSTLVVRGKLGKTGENLKVAVRWCINKPDGSFGAGLEFLDNQPTSSSSAHEWRASDSVNPETLDYYEVMQLSPNADPDTIARVFRMLALRYHPDNAETGSTETFVRLCEAHQCLSDPEKRARYDVHHRQTKRLRWKIFDQAATTTGSEGEKRKRQGILALLYAQTLDNPEHAEMNIQVLEELLGCPREHLQAALWYLKGKNLIQRSDGGRYSITIAGFDEAEAHLTAIGTNRRLTESTPAS
jgi:curved DNA-binding protein